MSDIGRRGFLKGLGALVASAALDPERLLWLPGQRTLFLPPQRTLVQARTLQEALSKGLTAVFPDGMRMKVLLGPGSVTWGSFSVRPFKGVTSVEDAIRREVEAVEYQGGRVIKVEDLQQGWNWRAR